MGDRYRPPMHHLPPSRMEPWGGVHENSRPGLPLMANRACFIFGCGFKIGRRGERKSGQANLARLIGWLLKDSVWSATFDQQNRQIVHVRACGTGDNQAINGLESVVGIVVPQDCVNLNALGSKPVR